MGMGGSESGSTPGRLEVYIDEFLDGQRAIGYSWTTCAERRSIVGGFAPWAQTNGVTEASLGNQHVYVFITRRPPRDVTEKERAAVRRFLAHLRARGVVPAAS